MSKKILMVYYKFDQCLASVPSNVKGVCFCPSRRRKCWLAFIQVAGKTHQIGFCESYREAWEMHAGARFYQEIPRDYRTRLVTRCLARRSRSFLHGFRRAQNFVA